MSTAAAVSDRAFEIREKTRARAVSEIPNWYSPWIHLGLTTSVGISVLIAGIASMVHVRWYELFAVPILLVVSNAVEWRAHKGILHKRRPPLGILYDRHTPVHHKIFTYDSMEISSYKELRLVLIPAVGVAAVVVIAAPFAIAAGFLLGRNAGWLSLMTSASYVVAYEWTHLAYHLPADSFIGRMGLVRVLREHHRRHHHPKLMQRWNFNVTVPLWDWLSRTIVPADVLARTVADPADDAPYFEPEKSGKS